MKATSDQNRPEPLPVMTGLEMENPISLHDDPTLIDLAKAPNNDGAILRLLKKIRSRINRWIWLILMFVIVLATVGAIYLGSQDDDELTTRIIPETAGMTVEEFNETIGDYWNLLEALDRLDGTLPGTILRTDPEAGEELEEGQAYASRCLANCSVVYENKASTIIDYAVTGMEIAMEGSYTEHEGAMNPEQLD